MCICLGMQLLGTSSQESPGTKGLGIFDAAIERFSNQVKVPQLGWNRVTPTGDGTEARFEPGEAYFANSFRLGQAPEGWGYATTDYDGSFVSCLWRGKTLACQFHPELSGEWGQSVLKRWCDDA